MILRGFLILALVLAAGLSASAQVVSDSTTRPADSVSAPPDSTLKMQKNRKMTAATPADSNAVVVAPPDSAISVAADSLKTAKDSTRFAWVPPVFRAHHPPPFDPQIAWKRALLFPGMGQIYNRSYWKVPIVYVTLAGIGGWIWYNNVYYQSFDKAYKLEYAGTDVTSIRIPFGVDNRNYVQASYSTFKNARDKSRRTRDQGVLIFLAAYGLSAVEAYVDAHLKNFDVSEDLSLHITPGIQQTPLTQGFTPGIRLALSFKE